MTSSPLLILPFVLQGLAMAVDEFYFHLRRGLPLWERVGHPIDTATFLAALLWMLFAPYSPRAIPIFLILAALSCLVIAKDEFVHKELCTGGEQLLHAFLFILHPIVLTAGFLMWPAYHTNSPAASLGIALSGRERLFMVGAASMIALFGVYQTLFWNLLWNRARGRK